MLIVILVRKMAYFCYKKPICKKNPHDTKITRRTKKILLLQRILLNNFLGGLSQSPLDYDGHFLNVWSIFAKIMKKERKK